MRGQRTLFDSFFQKLPAHRSYLHPSKGRSGEHILRRNSALLLRYYYHVNLCRRNFADALTRLEEEFYLSQSRIVDLMSECHTELSGIIADKPNVKELREYLPQYEFTNTTPRQ